MTREGRFEERSALALPGILADAPNPARVRAGRAGLLAGITFERVVDAGLRRGVVAGLLRGAWQCGRPVIGLRPDGAPVYGEGGPDFLAVTFNGQVVAIEAKSTGEARLPFIPEHQARALAAVADAGGLALLAVELRGRGRWIVPWREIRWCGPRGGASVGAVELAGWEMLDGIGGYLTRWCAR